MITDKDMEEAKGLADAIDNAGMGVTGLDKIKLNSVQKKVYEILNEAEKKAWIEVIVNHNARIRAAAAEEARREAADRAVAFVDENLIGLSEFNTGLIRDLRAAILKEVSE